MAPKNDRAGMTRRRFNQMMISLGAMGLLGAHGHARPAGERGKLYRAAYANPGREGVWRLTDIEGRVPKELDGAFVRVAPGEAERFGVRMKHLFDGDPFLTGFDFRAGRVDLRAQFLASPQRLEEQRAGEMIYSEFGTLAPGVADGTRRFDMKNQASVNIVLYDGRLLGLSEGDHPIEIDPETFAYRGRWSFHGTLPDEVTFTAHPKLDPRNGEGYGYGIARDETWALVVYRMKRDGRLEELHRLPRSHYFMIHDFAVTEDHLVFAIPPVIFDFSVLMTGRASVADAIRFMEQEPTRLLILRRDGTGAPIEIDRPPSMIFHHGNAYERDGQIHMVSLKSPDGSILRELHAFAADRVPESSPTDAVAVTIDPAKGTVRERVIGTDEEFPRFDERLLGKPARVLYTTKEGTVEEPFLHGALVRRDLVAGTATKVEAGRSRALEEAVFVPKGPGETEGWLLQRGFDGRRNETFLDIRDAATLERAARVWTGTHLPLGFHGNYMPGLHMT